MGRVHVTVRLFAGLRERAGWARRELDGIERVGDVWPALGLGVEPEGLLYAVNREYADADRPLAHGDEVALIPPVSGGSFPARMEIKMMLSTPSTISSAVSVASAIHICGSVSHSMSITSCQFR